MQEMFADLHVHIGRSEKGKPIKITAARSLNFANIAKECAERKGIQIVGIIDCASPYVIEDIEEFLKTGEAYEIKDGGIIYKDKVCIILGSEIETAEINDNGKTGSAHNLCYFPSLADIKAFSKEMSKYIKNITLSSQRACISADELVDIVEKFNGVLIPAHAFTPHKSFYGNCTSRLERIFKEKFNKIFAIELGLSADTELADQISELETRTFITNSDAHSLPKIAREYNKILVEDISFKAKKGETIAFIGSTGSGKSTLINLIPRFYDATKGEVLVDGVNVKEYKLKDLYNKLGYIPQRAVMFNGTVSSNIAYGENGKGEITKEKIKDAVKVAQAEEFVSKMENTYDAHIAQGGTNVSGGQKQRLSIARAIARDPEIYIFDDSFSALDYKTDSVLRKELKKYTKDATILIVAQRIGTIMNADKIIVLDNGKCAGIGTHKELLKTCDVYKEIALSQLSKEELENE